MDSSFIKQRRLLIAFLGVLFVSFAAQSKAAEWPTITSEEKALTSVPQQPDAPAVILYREEVTDDTKNFRTVYVRVKVLTEAGIKYGDVEIPVGRERFTISQVSGRTVHADGRVIPLEDQPVDRVVIKDHGVYAQVKAFTLSSVKVGSILDYRYSLHFPEDSRNAPDWMVQSELFQKRVLFKFVPTKYQPKIDSLRTDAQAFEIVGNTIGGEAVSEYTWINHLPAGRRPEEHVTPQALYKWVDLEMNNVPPFPNEPLMPPSDSVRWRVQFFYRNQTRVEDYWKRAGRSWNSTVESFINRRQGIPEFVNRLVAASDTPEMKVRKLYAAVGQLQNQSFATNPALWPAPSAGAQEVLQQHAGTHDELNGLFVAMVREAGIPATMMWVPDRGRATFDPNVMSTNQLDAEITVVQLAGQDLFLDPGTRFCPFGVLNWHYAGSRGLRQNGNGTAPLANSPPSTYKDADIQRVARLQLTDKGTMAGTLAVGFSGQEAMVRRQQAVNLDAKARQKLLEDEVSSWFPSGTQVTLTNDPEWDLTEGTLVGKFKVVGPLAVNNGQQWLVPIHVFEANEKPLFSSAERTSSICFDYASRQDDEVHIVLPPNAQVETLPPNQHLKTSYALFTTEQKHEGTNGIVLSRQMALNSVLFSPEEYKDLKQFFDKVAAEDKQADVLKGSL